MTEQKQIEQYIKLLESFTIIRATTKERPVPASYLLNAENEDEVCDSIEAAIAALREKLDRLNPKPLTVEEMNALHKEPVYVLHMDTMKSGRPWHMNGWHILNASKCSNHGQATQEVDYGQNELSGNYGITWLAYRTKPERSEHPQ